jgi:hypothetical protein
MGIWSFLHHILIATEQILHNLHSTPGIYSYIAKCVSRKQTSLNNCATPSILNGIVQWWILHNSTEHVQGSELLHFIQQCNVQSTRKMPVASLHLVCSDLSSLWQCEDHHQNESDNSSAPLWQHFFNINFGCSFKSVCLVLSYWRNHASLLNEGLLPWTVWQNFQSKTST